MSNQKVSLSFAVLTDARLAAFTENVLHGLEGNPHYPSPSPSLAALTAGLAAFTDALAAAAGGGKANTAAKNQARAALLGLLRPLAGYVQIQCQNDRAILLSSGFAATSTNRAQAPLHRPAIRSITNGWSTTLTLHVGPVSNAKSYEVRYGTAPEEWQAGGISTQAKRIVVESLTPGALYHFQVRAVGGSTGYSDWSDPLSHRAM